MMTANRTETKMTATDDLILNGRIKWLTRISEGEDSDNVECGDDYVADGVVVVLESVVVVDSVVGVVSV